MHAIIRGRLRLDMRTAFAENRYISACRKFIVDKKVQKLKGTTHFVNVYKRMVIYLVNESKCTKNMKYFLCNL